MLNAGVNQTSAVLRCGYGAMRRPGPAREIVRSAMREVMAIAAREGVTLDEQDMENGPARMGSLSPSGKTSMLQDVEAFRRTEAPMFGGVIAGLGREYGVPAAVNETLYRLILAIEESYGEK